MSYTPINPPVRRTGAELEKAWSFHGCHPDWPSREYVNAPKSFRSYWEWAADKEHEYRSNIYASSQRTGQQETTE